MRSETIKVGAGTAFLYAAFALWILPLGGALKTCGLYAYWPTIFATGSVATILSPILFGHLAELHIPAGRLLKLLGVGTAACLLLLWYAMKIKSPWMSIAASAGANILSSPTNNIIAHLSLKTLKGNERQYPVLRMAGTISWMIGGLLTSLLHTDASPDSILFSAGVWVCFGLCPFPRINKGEEESRAATGTLAEVWSLLRTKDFSLLLWPCIGLAVAASPFFAVAPQQLASLGIRHISATMVTSQISEIIVCSLLPLLLRSIKTQTLIIAGIWLALVRFGLHCTNIKFFVVLGVICQGACFALVFLPAQILIAQHAPRNLQIKAQAFFLVACNGIGTLFGFYIFGWWMVQSETSGVVSWSMFWMPSTALCSIILLSLYLKRKDNRKRLSILSKVTS